MKKADKKQNNEKGSINQEQLIYERVFDAILEQRLAPGARLTEEPLGEIFGVSRTIIRRVLLRLSHEGVVDIQPNKGARGITTPIEEVADYFAARKIVERAIIRIATKQITPYQIASLRSLAAEEKRYFESGTRGKGLRTSSEFHLQIAKIADNAPMMEFALKLISITALIVSQYQNLQAAPCAYCDHEALINAMEAGDADVAEQLMAEHIEHIMNTLQLEESTQEPDLFKIFGGDQGNDENDH